LILLFAGVEVYFALGSYSYLSFAFAGSFLIHVRLVPERRSWMAAATAGILYAALYLALGKPIDWLNAAGFLGVGSVVVLGLTALWSKQERGPEFRSALRIAIAFPAFLMCSGYVLACTLFMHPKTLDLYLYRFDGSLGFQASFIIGRWLHFWGLLRSVAYVAYESLPLSMAYGFMAERTGKRGYRADLFTAFVGAAVAGAATYNIFPAVGPIHVFGILFPFSPPSAPAPVPVEIATAPRNAMPSIHLAMVLLIFWHSRPWGWIPRIFAGTLLVLTVLATLGLGEHYLIDLVVAVPLALTVEAIATEDSPANHRMRVVSIGTGSTLVGLWILYLRNAHGGFSLSQTVAWCAVTITVVSALLLERALGTGTRGPRPADYTDGNFETHGSGASPGA
jgi:hypothetical protein